MWKGNIDMSRLSSSVINGSTYICTENGQKRNLNEYNKALRDKQQAEGKIKIVSWEINVLRGTIEGHNKTIARHQETINTKYTPLIKELSDYISKNCNNPKTTQHKALCTVKKNTKTSLEQSNKNLSNQITSLNTLIGRLEWQIKQKNENIATWTKKIEEYTKYIKEYDTCTESIKGKLIITSPLMSGEVKMALEVGKRAELYKFSMSMPAPGKAEINEIKFDTAFGPGNIELDDWYVTENSTTTSIYPCRLENNGQFRCALERIESGNFGLENGRVQNYSLSAVVKDIKEPGSFKIYGISKEGVLYNGTRRDADNQSTSIKINYAKKETSPKTDLASFSISAPKTVYVNEPFDLGVKALWTNGSLLQTYVGTIYFDTNGNNNSDVIFPTPNNEYTFVSNDYGEHTFQKGITLKKAGQYELVIFELNGPNGGIHGVVNIVAQEKTSTDCSSITGSDVCLKQDGCYYNEKTSKCTSEALKCEDASDAQDDIFTKGMIWWFARHVYSPRYYQASYDYCTGDTINQVSCDSEGFAKYTSTTCPNGCSDGACKKEEKAVCKSLTLTPKLVSQGWKIEYTCTGENAKNYLVTVKKVIDNENQEIVGTFSTSNGSFVIPENTFWLFIVECTLNAWDSQCTNFVSSIDGRPSLVLQEPSTSWQDYFFLHNDGLTPTYLNGYWLLFRMNVPWNMVVTKMTVKIVDEGKFIESVWFTDSKGHHTTKPVVNGKVIFDNLSEMPGESLPTFTPNYTKKSNFASGSQTTIMLESIEYTDGTTLRVLPIEKWRTTKVIWFSPSIRWGTAPGYFKNWEVNFWDFTYANSIWGNTYQILEIPVEFDLSSGHNSIIGNELKLLWNNGEIIPSSTTWINTSTNKKQAIITLVSPYNVTKWMNHTFTLFGQITNATSGDKIKTNIWYDSKNLTLIDTTGWTNFAVKWNDFGIGSIENTLTYKD